MKIHATRLAACLCATTILAAAAQAASPTPTNGKATLVVTYELKGAGKELPDSHEKNVYWTVDARYEVKAVMTAQKPSGFGTLHKPDAAEQQRESDRAAAAQAAATDMQPLMEQAQKIMEICGEDEACIQRETIKMSQGVNMNSQQMQDAKANVAAASVMPDVRYQGFQGGLQSGTYTVKETAHEAYFDAACSLATEARCAIDTTVNGKGKLKDASGATEFPSGTMAEIDFQTGSLIIQLALPGFASAKQTVVSKAPERPSGTTDVLRTVANGGAMDSTLRTMSCGECKAVSDSFEIDVEDQLLGRPAKLVVSWKFTRS
jgi:hypothetical protein